MQFAVAQRITCPQVLIQKHLIRLLSGRVSSELLLVCYYLHVFFPLYFCQCISLGNNTLHSKTKNETCSCPCNTCSFIFKIGIFQIFSIYVPYILGALLNQHPQPLIFLYPSLVRKMSNNMARLFKNMFSFAGESRSKSGKIIEM